MLARLAEILPADVAVRIVADRGFGDQKLYRVPTEELKFDFVIRFRGNIEVTADAYRVATVVCVRAKGMKEPWRLAASTTCEPARALINLYARRWEIEGCFRDAKDLRFGLGLGSMHVSTQSP